MNPFRKGPLKNRQSRSPFGRLIGRRGRPDPGNQTLVSHLVELRDRLLRLVFVVLAVFLVLSPFANELYGQLAKPLMSHLPAGTSMIATEVAAPFITPFKFTLVLAIFLAMPFALHQLWAFVAPGLYQSERRVGLPLLVSSSALFYMGMAFAYFVVFPLAFGFLIGAAPDGVSVMTDITKYLDFVLKMFFAFGLAFEVPVATFVVVWAGIASADTLAQKRPYVIVGAFVFGMLLTPPDAISQTLLALPMWLLFEAGIWAARTFISADEQQQNERQDDTTAESGSNGSGSEP